MAAQINGVVTGGPPTGPGGLFSLADPDALLAAIRTAGFADATLAEVSTNSVFASLDEYFDTVTSLAGPLSLAIAAASDETRAAMRRTAGDLAAAHRTPNGMTLAGRALVCSATAG
jgi:hypothetical protein